MGWPELIALILTYGIPVAESIFQKASSGQPPTQSDFDELNKLAAQTAQSHLLAAAARAGLGADDPRLKALLAMLPPGPPAA